MPIWESIRDEGTDDAERVESDRATLIDARVLEARARSRTDGRAAETCEDCGKEIPAERREAMERNGMPCERCVSCQTRFEKGSK